MADGHRHEGQLITSTPSGRRGRGAKVRGRTADVAEVRGPSLPPTTSPLYPTPPRVQFHPPGPLTSPISGFCWPPDYSSLAPFPLAFLRSSSSDSRPDPWSSGATAPRLFRPAEATLQPCTSTPSCIFTPSRTSTESHRSTLSHPSAPSHTSTPDSGLAVSYPAVPVPGLTPTEGPATVLHLPAQFSTSTPVSGPAQSGPGAGVRVLNLSRPHGPAQFLTFTPDSRLDLSERGPRVPTSAFRPYRPDRPPPQVAHSWSAPDSRGLDRSAPSPARTSGSAFWRYWPD